MKQARFFTRFLMLAGIIGALGITSSLYAASLQSGPGKNVMNCSNPIGTGMKDGNLGCYGIWDKGDAFGDDSDMCEDEMYNATVGCQVKTRACSSGIATATKHYSPVGMSLKDSQLIEFSKNLQSTPEIVQAQILGLWVYTCGKNVTPAEETGTYKGYMDEKLFITTENITKTQALENCKLNSKNNPKSSIYCTWKGDEIYRFTPKPIEETGILSVFVDGTLVMTGVDMSKSVALTQCKNKASSYPNSEIKCSWNNSQIYYVPKPETKATLYVYVNGSSNLTKENLTRETALTECKSRALQYSGSEVKCTWNGEQIYYVPKTESYAKLMMEVNGKIVYTQENITRDVALSQCRERLYSYANSEIKCSWNNSEIYYTRGTENIYKLYVNGERYDTKISLNLREAREACSQAQDRYSRSDVVCYWGDEVIFSSQADPDDEPEYCGYGYEYLLDIDRCIKSSSLTYYSLMKREFGTTISRLSVSKLKIVLERIEDIEYRYSENTTTRLKLEALKIIIEKEIREQEGDDFDFSDLFD